MLVVDVEDKVLFFKKSGQQHRFKDAIADVIVFEEAVVVRLATDTGSRNNRNVYAFDHRGGLLWQVREKTRMYEYSPFLGLYREGPMLQAFNYDGSMMTIHPRSGIIFSDIMIPFDHITRRPRPIRAML